MDTFIKLLFTGMLIGWGFMVAGILVPFVFGLGFALVLLCAGLLFIIFVWFN